MVLCTGMPRLCCSSSADSLGHLCLQRQALQDFQPRIQQLMRQQGERQKASRAAVHAVHEAQRALQARQTDLAEVQAEKVALQQAADEMERQLATHSQVGLCLVCSQSLRAENHL